MTNNEIDFEKIETAGKNLRTAITDARRKARNSKLMKQFVKGVVIGGVIGTAALVIGAIAIEVAGIDNTVTE